MHGEIMGTDKALHAFATFSAEYAAATGFQTGRL